MKCETLVFAEVMNHCSLQDYFRLSHGEAAQSAELTIKKHTLSSPLYHLLKAAFKCDRLCF